MVQKLIHLKPETLKLQQIQKISKEFSLDNFIVDYGAIAVDDYLIKKHNIK